MWSCLNSPGVKYCRLLHERTALQTCSWSPKVKVVAGVRVRTVPMAFTSTSRARLHIAEWSIKNSSTTTRSRKNHKFLIATTNTHAHHAQPILIQDSNKTMTRFAAVRRSSTSPGLASTTL